VPLSRAFVGLVGRSRGQQRDAAFGQRLGQRREGHIIEMGIPVWVGIAKGFIPDACALDVGQGRVTAVDILFAQLPLEHLADFTAGQRWHDEQIRDPLCFADALVDEVTQRRCRDRAGRLRHHIGHRCLTPLM